MPVTQYFWDAADESIGSWPAEWVDSELANEGGIESEDIEGSRQWGVVGSESGQSDSMTALYWNVPDDSNGGVIQAVMMFVPATPDTAIYGGGIGIVKQSNQFEGYQAWLRPDDDEGYLRRLDDSDTYSDATQLDLDSVTLDEDERWWIRIEYDRDAASAVIRARWWRDGDPEPGTWTVSSTDTTYDAATNLTVQLFAVVRDAFVHVAFVGVGTDGDEAPTAAPSGEEYDETGLATTITSTTDLVDERTHNESGLETSVASTTGLGDSLGATEPVSTAITATTALSDLLTMAEEGLGTTITATTVLVDIQGTRYVETGLATAIAATIDLSDQASLSDVLATSITSTSALVDVLTSFDVGLFTEITATTTLVDVLAGSGFELGLTTTITSETILVDSAAFVDALVTAITSTTALVNRKNKQRYTSGITKATGAGRATDTAGTVNGPSDAVGGKGGSRVGVP